MLTVDVAIVGGGIAGLWLSNLLRVRGYTSVLFEADALGARQTLASQGLIHGGLKYALGGRLTGASEAIAAMPERWRQCLAGKGDVDLSTLTPLSNRYYLFAADSTLGKLTTFFASRALRGRITRLARADYPPALAQPGFRGVVYTLGDLVVDTRRLLEILAAGVTGTIYRHRMTPDALTAAADGVTLRIQGQHLRARRLVLAAGAGNGLLLDALGIDSPRMQLRPLHQVIVRHDGLHPLFAHCLTGIKRPEPRLTITSHTDLGRWLYYLGGQIATDGAGLSAEELLVHARAELNACLPWVDWRHAELSTLRIDRAEPAEHGGRRPDEAFAASRGAVIVAWPTKLSLVPDLGERVLALLPAPASGGAIELDLPPAELGRTPWSR